MRLRHILAASDESEAGRQAVKSALDLATRASARMTVLRVLATESIRQPVSVTARDHNGGDATGRQYLRRWLEADVLSPAEASVVEVATAAGIPGIEICRFAEDAGVDLVVLGRKRHSPMMRLLIGDTADAVARRSRVPCLLIPPGTGQVNAILAALDGTTRGINVLTETCDFGQAVGAALKTITVERRPLDEPLDTVAELPVARRSSLQGQVEEVLTRKCMENAPLTIRRGDVTEHVLAEVQETGADVLAIGYRRGGPPGVLEAGSIARKLAHVAPCSVLTIPL